MLHFQNLRYCTQHHSLVFFFVFVFVVVFFLLSGGTQVISFAE